MDIRGLTQITCGGMKNKKMKTKNWLDLTWHGPKENQTQRTDKDQGRQGLKDLGYNQGQAGQRDTGGAHELNTIRSKLEERKDFKIKQERYRFCYLWIVVCLIVNKCNAQQHLQYFSVIARLLISAPFSKIQMNTLFYLLHFTCARGQQRPHPTLLLPF